MGQNACKQIPGESATRTLYGLWAEDNPVWWRRQNQPSVQKQRKSNRAGASLTLCDLRVEGRGREKQNAHVFHYARYLRRIWAAISSNLTNRSNARTARTGHLDSQSTYQPIWYLPSSWGGGDPSDVRLEGDFHLCSWGVPMYGDPPRGLRDLCQRRMRQDASEQRGE